MKDVYFQHIRREIAPLLPSVATRIVDVGCGAGSTLAWLRERFPNARTVGLERDPTALALLRSNADEAYEVDLSMGVPDLGQPDLVLLLDVLEHLPDPLAVLRGLVNQLSGTATVIISLPNVAHLSVSLPLLLKGEFRYQDAGILDRTHLRFFVRETAVELATEAGLAVDSGLEVGFGGRKSRLLDALTLGLARTRLAKQFILRATRSADTAAPSKVRWARG